MGPSEPRGGADLQETVTWERDTEKRGYHATMEDAKRPNVIFEYMNMKTVTNASKS